MSDKEIHSGRFIVLEGLDGAGTTTQGRALKAWLEARGQRVDLSAEPTDGPLGRAIRQVLRGELQLGGAERERIVALLFAADRLDHVGGRLEPLLAQGVRCISDRYLPSSLAYQAAFCPVEWVRTLNRYAREPDLTLFLDVPPEVGLARVASRDGRQERYEVLDTLAAVRANYLEWLKGPHASPVEVIDGTLPVDQVTRLVQGAVARLLGLDA
jgi:dTMP kinase